jgi:hypothetical protein
MQTITATRTTRHIHTTHNDIAKLEIDNHADTSCFGSNFTAVQFTGKHCKVSPFSDKYNRLPNVPIASVAKAWDNPNMEETTILLFHHKGFGLVMTWLLPIAFLSTQISDGYMAMTFVMTHLISIDHLESLILIQE